VATTDAGWAEASIIEGWKVEAAREPDLRDRRLLGHLTLTFANLAGCRAVWKRGLEGWAVIKSEYLEELREEVRTEARAEGEVEALRRAVLRQGQQRFGKAAGRKQKGQLRAVGDVAHLERILDQVRAATSWDDLLATP
jgi:hypothetical protein